MSDSPLVSTTSNREPASPNRRSRWIPNSSNTIRFALLSLFVLVPTIAEAQSLPGSGPAQIAILLPLTGDYGYLGEQMLDAIQISLADNGGVSWTVFDTEGDPDVARARVEEIADNPANIGIIGPIGVQETRAAAEVASERRIPLLSLTSDAELEGMGPYVFRLRVSVGDQARHIASVALDDLMLTRFAVLYPDDTFGQAATRAFVDEVTSRGGQVTAIESYEPDETNFNDSVELLVNQRIRRLYGSAFDSPPTSRTRRLSSVSSIDFQAVFIPDFHQRVGLLVHFLAFWDVPLDGRVQLLGISSWSGSGLQLGGELVDGALFSQVFHDTLYASRVTDFVQRFQEEFERSPTEAEAQAYDAVTLLIEVIDSIARHDLNRLVLRESLQSSAPVEGLVGPVQLDTSGGVVRELLVFSTDGEGYVGPHTLLH